MIRKFKIKGLTNNITLDLNDFNKFLLTNPSGLGVALTNEYIRILNKRINVKQNKDYVPITATIEVSGETRSDWEWNYAELRNFIVANAKDGFALYYSPIENRERYIICDVKLLSKTEKSSYGILVPVEFEIRSNWLEDRQISVEVEADNELGLGFYKEEVTDGENAETYYSYGFKYDLIGNEVWYDYRFVKGIRGEAELINLGDSETPLLITITSPCVNPLIQILDSNNVPVLSSRVNVSVNEGEKLIINSDPENLDVYIVTALNEKYHCVDKLDLSHDGFIQLPVGDYTLRITDDIENSIDGYINFSLQYLGG
jgi:hypothetical protein